MNFRVKILFCFAVLSSFNICSFAETIDDYPHIKSCYIQYLHGKGKLNEPFPLTVQPSSQCRLVIPFFKIIFTDKIFDMYLPRVADCAKNETVVIDELYDYFLQHYVLAFSSFFTEEGGLTRLEESTNHIDNQRDEIRSRCNFNGTDDEKNSTLQDHRTLVYCMRKYALDNHLLKVVDVNPYRIDTESVNCTNILAAERSKTETQFKEEISATDCAMNEFRSGNLFGWKAAMTALSGPYFPGENVKMDKKVEEFLAMPSSECIA